jgi:hypothetical protein
MRGCGWRGVLSILVNTIGGFEDTSVMQLSYLWCGLLANLVQTAPACCVAIYV